MVSKRPDSIAGVEDTFRVVEIVGSIVAKVDDCISASAWTLIEVAVEISGSRVANVPDWISGDVEMFLVADTVKSGWENSAVSILGEICSLSL